MNTFAGFVAAAPSSPFLNHTESCSSFDPRGEGAANTSCDEASQLRQ